MRNWKVRGTQQGMLVEIILQATDWTAAVQAATQHPHLMDVREAEAVDLQAVLMERLRYVHGFTPDRIRTTFACKDYMTAVGWKTAVVRTVVPNNGLNQIWLMGDYSSEGRNALAGTLAVMSQAADKETLYAAVDKFVQDVSDVIANTYAGRLLKAA